MSDDTKKHPDEDGKLSHDSTLRGDGGEKAQLEKSYSYGEVSDPFGDESNSEVKYKVLRWWQAAFLMIAEIISLGILSLPSVLGTIGFVGGMLLILVLGLTATYTGYVIGQYKLRHPHIHNFADAGELLLGPVGREVFGAAQTIFYIFVMGSHVLVFSIMLNTLTGHSTCSIVFGFVGMIVCLLCTLPRKLADVSWMAIVSFISILAAVMITMVGVGIEKPGHGIVHAVNNNTFAKGFLATTNIIFAYAGNVAFFSFISEFRKPEEYPKALFLLQGIDTFMYLLVAAVVYAFAGDNVKSPALSSTNDTLKKAAYGVAIPTIVIAGVINGHVAAKYIYVRLYRGTDMMSKNNWKSFGSWAGICVILWTIAWIIAEAIPVFNDLLGVVSSLFASWFTYGLSGFFWLHMNKGRYTESVKKMILTGVNILLILFAAFITIAGMYSTIVGIESDLASGKAVGPFTCGDNSAEG